MKAAAESKTGVPALKKLKGYHDHKPVAYFRNHPPEVQDAAWRHLSSLMAKHKERLEADYRHYMMILVATATRLALSELGLMRSPKELGSKGARTRNKIAWLRGMLGSAKISTESCEVSHTNMEGI